MGGWNERFARGLNTLWRVETRHYLFTPTITCVTPGPTGRRDQHLCVVAGQTHLTGCSSATGRAAPAATSASPHSPVTAPGGDHAGQRFRDSCVTPPRFMPVITSRATTRVSGSGTAAFFPWSGWCGSRVEDRASDAEGALDARRPDQHDHAARNRATTVPPQGPTPPTVPPRTPPGCASSTRAPPKAATRTATAKRCPINQHLQHKSR
jgi:hypothetical protein